MNKHEKDRMNNRRMEDWNIQIGMMEWCNTAKLSRVAGYEFRVMGLRVAGWRVRTI